jgi:hypothetical protein
MKNRHYSFLFGVGTALFLLTGMSGCAEFSFSDFFTDTESNSREDEAEEYPQPPLFPYPDPGPPPSPTGPVWHISARGNDANTGTDAASPLASVAAALSRIRASYRTGNWPQGESAIIVVSGRITASGPLGPNESMVDISSAGSYPPIILKGDPVIGGILDANRKPGENGRVIFILNNTVVLGEKLTLTGGNKLWGGAVCIGTNGSESAGVFIMEGGEISGNAGASGGAVMIYKGSMRMSAGVIKNNRNDYPEGGARAGGGVYVSEYTSFIMTGGKIEQNGDRSLTEKGGGIFVDGRGIATMEGGEILDNMSKEQGGGVYIAPRGTFIMSDGTISGNSSGAGGGVYESPMNGTVFQKNGGTISGNTPD